MIGFVEPDPNSTHSGRKTSYSVKWIPPVVHKSGSGKFHLAGLSATRRVVATGGGMGLHATACPASRRLAARLFQFRAGLGKTGRADVCRFGRSGLAGRV